MQFAITKQAFRSALRAATASLCLVAGLVGCTTGPDYRAPVNDALQVPERWQQPAGGARDEAELATWWQRFHEPALNTLVEQVIAGNLDVVQAQARLTSARAAAVQARAGFFPQLALNADGGRNYSNTLPDSSNFSVGADASWQLDLFGGTSSAAAAAAASAKASAYDLAAVRTAIIAETASNYIRARLAQENLGIARDTLVIQSENYDIARWRARAGLVSAVDEELARGQRAQTSATIPSLEQNYANAVNRIAVLTGAAPGAASALLAQATPIPVAPAGIAAGIPADTLRQRPDVRASERSLAAATAAIGVASAALYPSLRIGGTINSNAASAGNIGDLVSGRLFAGLSQVIFSGGSLRAQVRSQQAAAEGALAAYQQTVLNALEDVENALVAMDAADRRANDFAEALDAANNSASLARNQYQTGLTDFQTLLSAERSLLAARQGLAGARADQALAAVQLYTALGGGWENEEA